MSNIARIASAVVFLLMASSAQSDTPKESAQPGNSLDQPSSVTPSSVGKPAKVVGGATRGVRHKQANREQVQQAPKDMATDPKAPPAAPSPK